MFLLRHRKTSRASARVWDGNVLSLSKDFSRHTYFVKDKTNKKKLADYFADLRTWKADDLSFCHEFRKSVCSAVEKLEIS